MLVPTGTFLSVNFPLKSVRATETGSPETGTPHLSHVAPVMSGVTPAFGM
jgi:hypothetical protein